MFALSFVTVLERCGWYPHTLCVRGRTCPNLEAFSHDIDPFDQLGTNEVGFRHFDCCATNRAAIDVASNFWFRHCGDQRVE